MGIVIPSGVPPTLFKTDLGFLSFEGQNIANMSSKIDAKIGIEKSSFRGGLAPKYDPRLVLGGG